MLKLSDCELANLRLECCKAVWERSAEMDNWFGAVGVLLEFCLRDRDEPGAGE